MFRNDKMADLKDLVVADVMTSQVVCSSRGVGVARYVMLLLPWPTNPCPCGRHARKWLGALWLPCVCCSGLSQLAHRGLQHVPLVSREGEESLTSGDDVVPISFCEGMLTTQQLVSTLLHASHFDSTTSGSDSEGSSTEGMSALLLILAVSDANVGQIVTTARIIAPALPRRCGACTCSHHA